MYDVAIVGLGATGVSLLSQIQDEVYKVRVVKPHIAVFNPLCSFASGKAFGDADAVHKHQALSSPEREGSSFLLKTKIQALSFAHLWDATGGASILNQWNSLC